MTTPELPPTHIAPSGATRLGPDELDPPHPPRESRLTKVVIALLGAGLLFGPWAAYAAGSRSDAVPGENRALASRPQIDGFQTFEQITAYAADHFPLRDAAIRTNKSLIQNLFGENPSYAGSTANVQVLEGKQGWLYFLDDFNRACKPDLPLPEVLAGVQRMNDLLAASGRRLVLAVPPDKSTADPQFLPDNFDLKRCSAQAKEARWKALRGLSATVPGYVDVRTAVERQEDKTGDPAFLSYDTHWTERSAAVFVQEVAKELDPALAQGTSVVKGEVRKQQGDLQVLNGVGRLFEEQGYDVVRQGVTSASTTDHLGKADSYEVNHFTSTTVGPAQLFQPRTVWVGDSFTQRALPKIWGYFRDMTRVPELTKAILANRDDNGELVYPKAEARMLQEMAASKVVVVELVERTFAGNKPGSPFSADFLDKLEQALAAAPKQ